MGETAGLNNVKEKLLGMGHVEAGEHNWYSLMGVQETRLASQLVSVLQSVPVPSVLNKTKTEQRRGYAVRSSWGMS